MSVVEIVAVVAPKIEAVAGERIGVRVTNAHETMDIEPAGLAALVAAVRLVKHDCSVEHVARELKRARAVGRIRHCRIA